MVDLAQLATHKNILVTGENRAGTTIAATIIAFETGHRLIVEEDVNFMPAGVEAFLATDEPKVIQAPFMSPICHQYPKACVVFVWRSPEDIKASKGRQPQVFWPKFEIGRRANYHTNDYSRSIMEIALENWNEQRERLPDHLTVHFDDLRSHALFEENRTDWGLRQTSAVA